MVRMAGGRWRVGGGGWAVADGWVADGWVADERRAGGEQRGVQRAKRKTDKLVRTS